MTSWLNWVKIKSSFKTEQHLRKIFKIHQRSQKADKPSIAYFSMEYGLTEILKIYSGGLGVLAGDYLKEASDYGADMTAIGFLYRHGYFTQLRR